jgi:hypothetical protein
MCTDELGKLKSRVIISNKTDFNVLLTLVYKLYEAGTRPLSISQTES